MNNLRNPCDSCSYLYGDKIVCGGCVNGTRWVQAPVSEARRELAFENMVLDLWRAHGGDQHGPHVETLTIPLSRFRGFVREFRKLVEEELDP